MRKILLVGRTGVGKSSFINSTFGKYIAETSRYEACTKIMQHYAINTPFGDVCLIDTPGLAEDNIECDLEYLKLIKSNVSIDKIDVLIYVSRLDETRFRPEEKRTLLLITEKLGAIVWSKAWLLFTFAASVSNERRQEVSVKRKDQIEAFLRQITLEKGLHPPFQSFKAKLRIDNTVNSWSSDRMSVVSALTEND